VNDDAAKLRRARLAVARYVSLAVLTYVSGWLDQIGDVAIAAVKWNQWATLGIGVATSALVALGAVMNQTWSQVKPPQSESK